MPAFIAGRGVGMEPNHTTAKRRGLLLEFLYTCIFVLYIVYVPNYSGFARFRNAGYVMQPKDIKKSN